MKGEGVSDSNWRLLFFRNLALEERKKFSLVLWKIMKVEFRDEFRLMGKYYREIKVENWGEKGNKWTKALGKTRRKQDPGTEKKKKAKYVNINLSVHGTGSYPFPASFGFIFSMK